jgi:hypothetical protein
MKMGRALPVDGLANPLPLTASWSETRDTEQIAQLFHDTIRTVNLGDYTPEQVEAWPPAPSAIWTFPMS